MSALPRLIGLAVLSSVLLPGCLAAEQAEEPGLEQLRFLAGHWCDETVEELWLEPRGGIMPGLNRSMRSNGTAAFEYLRIEQRADGIFLVASPGGKTPTDFRMTAVGEQQATFENPEHDFPVRILYALQADGQLRARAEGPDGQGPQWLWKPCPAPR